MLNDYKRKYNKSTGIWLRYIDDTLDKASLEHFLKFCENYSSNQTMKSIITFTYDYSTDYVYFLDTKVKFKKQSLITEIYSKPTASFHYLHRTSYHPSHSFRSVLKSQFIRSRCICSDINKYWSHSKRFPNFSNDVASVKEALIRFLEKFQKIPATTSLEITIAL